MSRWRRSKKKSEVAVTATLPEMSDVRIIGPSRPADRRSVLDELSEAFAADGSEDDLAGGAHADTDDRTDPDATAPTNDRSGLRGRGEPGGAASPSSARTTISIGGDDDLPDAVYLDDELGDDPSDTVFIDDDGTGDTVPARDAISRGIDPRLRQRRIGVRRAEGRTRLRVVGVVAVVLVLLVGLLAVLGSSLFSVSTVDVTGVRFSGGDEITSVVDDLTGRPVLLVDVDDAERRLEAIPYIEDARVRTEFPDTVRIEVRERVAVATSRGSDGRFRILDADGRIVDVIDGRPVAFVSIESDVPLDAVGGAFAPDGFAAAAAMVTKLTAEIRPRLVSMSTTPDGSDLRLLLSNGEDGDIEVRFGSAVTDNDQIERLVRLQLLLDDVADGDTTVIDVSTAEATER